MDHRPHIVVVEDEAAQRQLLVDYLGRQNFRVSSADGGTALRKLLERELPALVLLDVGLPGEDGFVLARWLRERSGRIGIIMVTAAVDTVDRVVGLETGADDYIAKPFEPRELLARVKACSAVRPARPPVPVLVFAWAAACSIWKSACWSIPHPATRKPWRRVSSTCSRCSPRTRTGRSIATGSWK
jgi:DNA-binding response OmpR family regulator